MCYPVVSSVMYIGSCSVLVPWLRSYAIYDNWRLWYKTSLLNEWAQTLPDGTTLGVFGLFWFVSVRFPEALFNSPSSLLLLQFGYAAFAYYSKPVSCPIWLSGKSVYDPPSRMKDQCASHINSFVERAYVRMYVYKVGIFLSVWIGGCFFRDKTSCHRLVFLCTGIRQKKKIMRAFHSSTRCI